MEDSKGIWFQDPNSGLKYNAQVSSNFFSLPEEGKKRYINDVLLPAARDGKLTSWGDTLKGAAGSLLRGGTLGFSKYLLPNSWNEYTDRFTTEHPTLSTVTEIGGGLAAPVLAAAEAALLPEEAMLGGGIGGGILLSKILGSVARRAMIPNAVDTVAKGAVKELAEKAIPNVSKGIVDAGSNIASSALQGGVYNYNTSKDGSGSDFVQGALTGGVLHSLGTGIGKLASKTAGKGLNAVTNKLGLTDKSSAADYILNDADTHKSSADELINRLRDLSNSDGNIRVLDANRELLGGNGLLGALAFPSKKLSDRVGRAALSDIKTGDIIANNSLNNTLGELHPDGLSALVNELKENRNNATKALYDKFNNSNIDISKNDDLLNNLAKNADYVSYLNKVSGNYSGKDADLRNIDNLINNRARLYELNKEHNIGPVITNADLIKGINDNTEANKIVNNYLQDIIAKNGINLNTKGDHIVDYIDNNLLNNEDVYSKQYKKIYPNAVSPEERQALILKDALRKVSPSYDEAQSKYQLYSAPLNQIDLANSLGNKLGDNKSVEQATNNYLNMYNNLLDTINSSKDIQDVGKLATRHSVQNLINDSLNKADNNSLATAAMDVIGTPHINDRLSGIYGNDNITNLLRNLSEQDELNKERALLNRKTNNRIEDDKTSQIISSIPMPHKALSNVIKNWLVTPYNTNGNSSAIVDLLLSHPNDALPILEAARDRQLNRRDITLPPPVLSAILASKILRTRGVDNYNGE